MKTPTEKEIIEEVEDLKTFIKNKNLEMGVSEITSNKIRNKINKILRLLKTPCRRIDFKFTPRR